MPAWKRILKATAQRGMCELASAVQRRHVGALPASSGYHVDFHEGYDQKHTNPLNCRTSSSDISDYHANFHKRMALSENGRGAEWHV
jgi:hypothetical protein